MRPRCATSTDYTSQSWPSTPWTCFGKAWRVRLCMWGLLSHGIGYGIIVGNPLYPLFRVPIQGGEEHHWTIGGGASSASQTSETQASGVGGCPAEPIEGTGQAHLQCPESSSCHRPGLSSQWIGMGDIKPGLWFLYILLCILVNQIPLQVLTTWRRSLWSTLMRW